MKKLNMLPSNSVTFEDGCNKYLDNCRQRNLRDGTINHYKQSYTQFFKFFDKDMPIETFTSEMYKRYAVHLKNTLQNDVSINWEYAENSSIYNQILPVIPKYSIKGYAEKFSAYPFLSGAFNSHFQGLRRMRYPSAI